MIGIRAIFISTFLIRDIFYQSKEWDLIDDLQRADINTPDRRDPRAHDRCEADQRSDHVTLLIDT